MAYFPHAFQKMMLATNATPFVSDTTKYSHEILAGQLGVVDNKTNKVIDLAATPTYGALPIFYFAQGSLHASDKMGQFHGGYKESVKSKGINPRYVSKVWVTEPSVAKNNIVKVSPAINSLAFACNTTYYLRVDAKGSPVLRTIDRNAYQTFDAFTGCCVGTDNVDPNVVLLQWKDQINASMIISKFVLAKVWNLADSGVAITPTSGSTTIKVADAARTKFTVGKKVVAVGIPENTYVVTLGAAGSGGSSLTNVVLSEAATASAGVNAKIYVEIATATYTPTLANSADTNDCHLDLFGAYVDTVFSDCTFQRSDNVDYAPVEIYASGVDELDNVCTTIFVTAASTQDGYQGKGYGDPLLKDLILSKSYEQEDYHDNDPRLREVLDENGSLVAISRSAKYFVYNVLYSIPRRSNPSSIMDSDQYLVKIVCSARSANFESFLNAILTSAGNPVQVEVEI